MSFVRMYENSEPPPSAKYWANPPPFLSGAGQPLESAKALLIMEPTRIFGTAMLTAPVSNPRSRKSRRVSRAWLGSDSTNSFQFFFMRMIIKFSSSGDPARLEAAHPHAKNVCGHAHGDERDLGRLPSDRA